MEHGKLEEGLALHLDFNKLEKIAGTSPHVVPTVVQDVETGAVLIVGYANRQALEESLERKVAVLWSTSRNELWIKGATSGDYLKLEEIRVNCEQNSLLYLVRLEGKGSCHTKDASGNSRFGCYYRKLNNINELSFVDPATHNRDRG